MAMFKNEYPCYRSICVGIMKQERKNGPFVCDCCGAKAWKDELDEHYDGMIDLELGDNYNGVWGYSQVFDEDGEPIPCPECQTAILERESDGAFICPICGHVMTEEELDPYWKSYK